MDASLTPTGADIGKSIMGVISSSIGSAASIYVLVAITGYFTFGDNIKGNIVSMCRSNLVSSTSTFRY